MPTLSQGPLFPTVAASVVDGGTEVWSNVGNIFAEDGVFASASLDTGVPDISYKLEGKGFGFSIPSDATVVGILAEVKRRTTTDQKVEDTSIRILKAGAEVGTDKSLSEKWSNVLAWKSFGGSSDLWGTTWTPADINGAGFGLRIQCDPIATAIIQNALVDAFRITVYYSIPTPSQFVAVVVGG